MGGSEQKQVVTSPNRWQWPQMGSGEFKQAVVSQNRQ